MSKTVSRSGDNGESQPVPVADLGGHFEEHRPDPVELSKARTPAQISFEGMQSIETNGWIENLMSSSTVFTSAKGSFKLSGNGYHGSIQTIDEAIRRDAYVLRAVQRGRIRFLTDDEAMERIGELQDETSHSESHLDHLRESLNAGASDNNGMYKIPLPDEAEPKGPSQTWEQVWQGSNTPKPKNV